MPKRITPTHKRDMTTAQPGAVTLTENAEHTAVLIPEPIEVDCPNEARIAAIERKLAELGDNENLPAPINDDHTDQRLNAIMRQVENLRSQVEAISDLPRLDQSDIANLSTALNSRVQKMIEDAISKEVTQIKIRMSSIERTSAPSLAQDVEQLGRIVTETGKLVASMDERSRGFEAYVEESRQAFKNLRKEFYGDLAQVMGRVVDNFQEAS